MKYVRSADARVGRQIKSYEDITQTLSFLPFNLWKLLKLSVHFALYSKSTLPAYVEFFKLLLMC